MEKIARRCAERGACVPVAGYVPPGQTAVAQPVPMGSGAEETI